MQIQTSPANPLVRICSSHPLVIEVLRNAIENGDFYGFSARLEVASYGLPSRGSGDILLLDGCCSDWPEVALQWQQNAGKVLVLLSADASHQNTQLRALFLGVTGVVVISRTWQRDLRHAIKALLEGRPWISGNVLDEYIRRTSSRGRNRLGAANPGSELTVREEQILSLLLRGNSNKQIGSVLGISARTVKYHVSNILHKSHVSRRKELVHPARRDDGFRNLGLPQPVSTREL